MSELRATEGQSQVTRRQLHHQHRTLTRALIDPDLQRLRREGKDILTRLEERAQWLPASEDVRSVGPSVNIYFSLFLLGFVVTRLYTETEQLLCHSGLSWFYSVCQIAR
jgi:hypothetical protein